MSFDDLEVPDDLSGLLAGDDLGEKPRTVTGDPLTEADADAFAAFLNGED